MTINNKKNSATQATTQTAAQTIPLQECLAKTYKTSDGTIQPGHTVRDHCLIVGEVARELVNRLPPFLREALFPPGVELVAALHDLGKVSPTFQKKIRRNLADLPSALIPISADLETSWGGHASLSQYSLKRKVKDKFIAKIVGRHHGRSPKFEYPIATDQKFGGKDWQHLREQLIEQLKQDLAADWPTIQHWLQAQVVAGLTSVSDWVGSGPFFEDPSHAWQSRISAALDNAGFVPPTFLPDLTFGDIFKSAEGIPFQMKDIQHQLVNSVDGPGVYILEAPMGLGKTEAALYAAYIALAQGKATGLYFALPTQLTSEKIHERVNEFLQAILAPDCPHRESLLVHANAWLKEMGEEGQPGRSWFSMGKRKILAPFAVGTVDQALMAVMNVKHGFVRAFGLAGKVVILDEVHTYDAYTGTILDALVKALPQLGCTVIILSATLTTERSQVFLQAQSISSQAYPRVLAKPNAQAELIERVPAALPSHQVVLQFDSDPARLVDEAVARAEQGQQVLWIENTVREAQERFKILAATAAESKVDCGLLHSRFLKQDRNKLESEWVELFGKQGWQKRLERGRILVGTQVLEQSLDIDADFLVTRFAPTDMLLQRMGRLWRHDFDKRCPSAHCEAWILAPDLGQAIASPQDAFGASAVIYSPYVLCRSLEVWQDLSSVQLPSDIRSLIEATYKQREEVSKMIQWHHELEHGTRFRKGKQALELLALTCLSTANNEASDEHVTTRYSDTETSTLLLLKSLHLKDQQAHLTLLDGTSLELPFNGKSLDRRHWREKAATLTKFTLDAPANKVPENLKVKELHWLQDYMYLGHDDGESLVRVALVRQDGQLESIHNGSCSDHFVLTYDSRLGYQTTPIER